MTGDDTIDRDEEPSPSQVRDLAGEAMRRRIAARLFGEEVDAVFLGRFRIIEALGHGGMGVVYAAEDDQLDRRVAIKVIREDRMTAGPRERTRLLREARSLAKLSHPNVVQVYEVGEHSGGVFIVMELVRGTTLRAWLSAERRSLAEVLARFIEAGQGLAAAHRVGIVHRDFKPANALVGEDGRVRIVDFGLARGDASAAETAPDRAPDRSRVGLTGGTSLASTATPAGTPGYMAPEQLLGAASDARSDQYSFCVALFEAVYGRPPIDRSQVFPGASASALVPADRRVPAWLRRLLARGLATRPEDRHASMATLIAALQEVPRRRRVLQLSTVGALALTAALALATALGGALLERTGPPLCAAPGSALADDWSEPQRAAIEAAFAATDVPYARSTWTRVAATTDAYVARWSAVRSGACEARLQGDSTGAEYDASIACLEDTRARFGGLLAVLQTIDAATLAEADALVAALPAPERCRGGEPQVRPREADGRALRGLLDRAEIAFRAARGGEAMALLGPLIAHLQASEHRSMEAEALLLQGKVEGRLLRRPARAQRSLHAAQDRALAHRPELLWEIWNEQAWVSAAEFAAEQARQWWEHARHAAGAGADATARASLAMVESQVLLAERRFEAAAQRGHDVVALLAGRGPGEHPDLLATRVALAANLGQADRISEARAMNRALLAELTGRLGGEHPMTAQVELNLGLDAVESGDHDEARPHVEHAREVLVTSLGRNHPRVATADLALAMLDGSLGAFGAAIDRARASSLVASESLGAGSAARIQALTLLAALYGASGRLPDLLQVNSELLAIHRGGVRHTAIDVAGLLANIGDGLCALGRCQEALPYFGELLAMQHGAAADPQRQALAQRGMGLVHLAHAEPASALLYLERALALMQALATSDENDLVIAATAAETAEALTQLRRDPARARSLRALARRLEARLAATGP